MVMESRRRESTQLGNLYIPTVLTKLSAEALHSINVFLDEFLFNILKNAGSLLTDNLRASLLGLLPTALGKEALLEAEVELRAYWDRTAVPDGGAFVDDSKVFHLQWAFEVRSPYFFISPC